MRVLDDGAGAGAEVQERQQGRRTEPDSPLGLVRRVAGSRDLDRGAGRSM